MRCEVRLEDGEGKGSVVEVRVMNEWPSLDCAGCGIAGVLAQAIGRMAGDPIRARSWAECVVDHMHTALDARERGKR